MNDVPRDWTLTPRVGVSALCSPLEVGADRAPQAARQLAELLEKLGCEVVQAGVVDDPEKSTAAGRQFTESHVHAVACVATSWFEDYLVVDLLEECPAPALLWSLPGMETGALCGVQQLTCCLKELGRPLQAVFGPLDAPQPKRRASTFLQAAALAYRLRRARIGLGGHRVAGMTEVAASEWALKRSLGPRIVPLDLPQLLARAQEMPEDEAQTRWQQLVDRAAACEVSQRDGIDTMQVFAAVTELIDRYRLDALTIGCYPHLMGRVCLAASLLAERGIPLGCEGDVNGAVGQLMLTLLTGQPTHNTDWLDPMEDGSVVFTHCGSGSLNLAHHPEDIRLASVRLMGQGACALFPARPGPVTLLNLVPRGAGYQAALLEGEAVPTTMVFPGNPLRVRFAAPVDRLIEWIHDEGIGHHWMAAYGHMGETIRCWSHLAGPDLRLIDAPAP